MRGGRFWTAWALAIALTGLSLPAFCGQSAQAGPEQTVSIRGRVVSAAHGAVASAAVHLRSQSGDKKADAVTDAAGVFVFAGLQPGAYELTAEKAELLAPAVHVVATTAGDQPQIELRLENANDEMQFADAPTFTVAGVTDWTAAGGHGSDAILRTSEALTRETLTLKPDQAKSSAGEVSPDAPKSAADRDRREGDDDEKRGDAVAAVRAYEQAVRKNPSEENYFAWGSELLLHRAIWQAKAVFEEGVKAHPKSVRLLTGLSSALFAGALYGEAAERICAASDLKPADAEPYSFMGRIEMAAPNPLPCVEERLARFVRLEPENSAANYLYAMAIWKQHGQTLDAATEAQVRTLLTKAVALDAKCADAYLQMGNLNASMKKYPAAIGSYRKAIDANPELSEAHYRLAMAYERIGDQASAQAEFRRHDEIEKKQAAEVERQRRDIKQFVVVTDGKAAGTGAP